MQGNTSQTLTATSNGSSGNGVINFISSVFKGNLSVTGNKVELDANNGIVRFAGSNNQTVSGNLTVKFKKLIIEKTGGHVTLDTSVSVSGILKLVSGNIITTSAHLLTMLAGSSVTGASNSSFVSGPVKKVGNTAFTFPTGKGNSYRAVEISAPSNSTDAFTGEYFDTGQTLGEDKDSSIEYLSTCGYWYLTRNVGSSSVYVTLKWSAGYCRYADSLGVYVANWNGTKWINQNRSAVVVTNSDGYVKSLSSLNNFGYFTHTFSNLPSTCGFDPSSTISLPQCGVQSLYQPNFPASTNPLKTLKLNFVFVVNNNPNDKRNFDISDPVIVSYFQNITLTKLNFIYENIVQPTGGGCSTHNINDSRIRFVINDFFEIEDAFGSNEDNYFRCPSSSHYLYNLLKTNLSEEEFNSGINIVFTDSWCFQEDFLSFACGIGSLCGCAAPKHCGGGGCALLPFGDECADDAAMIMMNNYYTGYLYNLCVGNSIASGFEGVATTLAHELGHNFSLQHKPIGCNHIMSSSGAPVPGNDHNFFDINELGAMHSIIQYGKMSKYLLETTYNSTSSVTIPSGQSQTWTISRVIGGDVIIEPGAVLTIECKVKMPRGGKIIVQRGGKLDVNGGLLTTNACTMWDGVEVWGDENYNQYSINSATGTLYQGKVIIRNGGAIEYAHHGVLLGKPKPPFFETFQQG